VAVLLDTHALLWFLTEPERLSHRATELLADRSTALVVSAASAWEIATKHRLGKLPQAEGLIDGYQRHLDRAGIESLSVTNEHAISAGTLSWDHRDPFDRMLAATSMIESLPLVTADAAFRDLNGIRLIW
jgi:PIN domain nuclease of toxin-antitoxin system